MPASDEIQQMKAKDLFEVAPILTGRTQIDSGLGYNAEDFEVDSNNIVNLKNKTSYWSCSGLNFTGHLHTTTYNNFHYSDDTNGKFIMDNDGGYNIVANVNLPEKTIITGVIVYGSVSTRTCTLNRIDISAGTSEELTSEVLNSEDTSIATGKDIVDNSNYAYLIKVADVGSTEQIYGARITYTTDHD